MADNEDGKDVCCLNAIENTVANQRLHRYERFLWEILPPFKPVSFPRNSDEILCVNQPDRTFDASFQDLLRLLQLWTTQVDPSLQLIGYVSPLDIFALQFHLCLEAR